MKYFLLALAVFCATAWNQSRVSSAPQRLGEEEMNGLVGASCPHIKWPQTNEDGSEKRNYTNCRPSRGFACGGEGITGTCAVHPQYANKCTMFEVINKIERCWRSTRKNSNYDCLESGTGEQCAEYRVADKTDDGCGADGACDDDQAQPCAEGVFEADYFECVEE